MATDLRLSLISHQEEGGVELGEPFGLPAHDARRLLRYLHYCLGSWSKASTAFEQTLLQLARGNAAHVFEVAQSIQRRLKARSEHGAVPLPLRGPLDPDLERLSRAAERFDQLAPEVRRAVCLREWDGMSFEEIATTLGLGAADVERLFFAAR